MSIKSILKNIIPTNLQPALLRAYLKTTSVLYKGTKHECSCCNGKFRKFLTFDGYGTKRENARCPKCGSLERHRLLWLFMKSELNIFNKKISLLHIAPEPGIQQLLQPLKNIDYLSADIASPLAMVKMDITDIQYPDNSFDAIICAHVLNHVDDDKKAMNELYRVLKADGWIIIQTPVDYNREKTFEDSSAKTSAERKKVFGQQDLARLYGKDFIDRLRAANFNVKIVHYGKTLGSEISERMGLMEDDEIFYCTKG